MLAAEDRPVEVDRHQAAPLLDCGRLDVPQQRGARIVDQNVELAEIAHDPVVSGDPFALAGDVEWLVGHARSECRGGTLRGCAVDVPDDDPGAFRGERLGRRQSDPRRPTGDQRDLVLYATHAMRPDPPCKAMVGPPPTGSDNTTGRDGGSGRAARSAF